jgi:hypothetical protein
MKPDVFQDLLTVRTDEVIQESDTRNHFCTDPPPLDFLEVKTSVYGIGQVLDFQHSYHFFRIRIVREEVIEDEGHVQLHFREDSIPDAPGFPFLFSDDPEDALRVFCCAEQVLNDAGHGSMRTYGGGELLSVQYTKKSGAREVPTLVAPENPTMVEFQRPNA